MRSLSPPNASLAVLRARRAVKIIVLALVWMGLTVGGWWLIRPMAVARVLEFTLTADAGSVWALEWERESDGSRNGVWIEVGAENASGELQARVGAPSVEMKRTSEQRVLRRVAGYRVRGVVLRHEMGGDGATIDDATCAVRVFGVPIGRVETTSSSRKGVIELGALPRVEPRESAVGLMMVGLACAAVLFVPMWTCGFWRHGLGRVVTPVSVAWLLVITMHAWMAAWAPVLYCPDSMGYLAGAIRLVREGTLAGFEGPRVPGYGVLLAGLWILPGEFGAWVGVLQSLLGVATAWCSWRVAKKLMPAGWSELVLVLVGCSPLLLGWQRFVMSETLAGLCVVVAAWLGTRPSAARAFQAGAGMRSSLGADHPSRSFDQNEGDSGFGRAALWACVLGLVCAVGAYTRGNLQLVIIFAPLMLMISAWRRWGIAGAPVLGAIAFGMAVACVMPRVMRNLTEYGEARLVVGEGYQRNLTTQMTGIMDDNQSGVLSVEEWRRLQQGRRDGTFDAYSAQDVWLRSDRIPTPAGLKGWGERSGRLDVPAMESIAREPARAARVATHGTLNILGVWRTEKWGFAENEYWMRPLRGVREGGTRNSNGITTNMWTGREIVEAMSALSVEDQGRLWTRTNRDITRAVSSGHARLFARWWDVEDALRPIMAGLFVLGGVAALVRRDWAMLVISLLVVANAAALAVLTLSGIDRYGVPFEPLMRVAAVYGAWWAWECVGARRTSSRQASSAFPEVDGAPGECDGR